MPQTNQKLIAQGAEAKIIQEEDNIIKDRVSKSYRHPKLDKRIIKTRTKSEAKLLEKASVLGISPKPIEVTNNKITIPFIEGKKLSEYLEQLNYKEICREIGKNIAKLHDSNIIHGDLTTSNMILTQDNNLFFIDFGLGFISNRIEDKAVDLHLIKQALEAKHFTIHKECEKIILENYKPREREKIFEQLKKVEARGRYKQGS